MNNQHDEIKRLLDASRKMLKKNDLSEERKSLINSGIINEQNRFDEYNQEPSKDDKQKSYRVSGGLITLHGKENKDLELTTDEKTAFQETMDEFVDEVSDLSDFGSLNIFSDNVDWSGKVIDFDVEFYYSIGENNGVYINGDMIKLDDNLMELLLKLTKYYEKFKAKWARVISQRKKTIE